ncbi:MAG: alpha/beta hydrolase [Planctomycetota bacterium]
MPHDAKCFACLLIVLLLLPGCIPALGVSSYTLEGLERKTALSVTDGERRELSYLTPTDTPPGARRVIFVHGTPGEATNYLGFLQDPPANAEVLAVDRIGFGESSRGPARFGALTRFAEQGDAIAPLMQGDNGGPVILVGHSLGGPIVCHLAARYPERVAGIVVLAGSVDPDLERRYWYNYVALLSTGLIVDRRLLRANIEVFAARRETRSLAPLLDHITCPVVIIHGTDDTLVPFANTAYLTERLVNAESVKLIAIEGEGHFLPWTQTDLIRSEIEAMVR